jgi:hypothetical protein
MVKGRGPTIFDTGVSLVTSTSRSYADDDDLNFEPLVSTSKLKRISNYADDDFNAVKGQSRRQDAALLNSITNRLNKFELDSVKPDRDVAMKTGFRRIMYYDKMGRVPVSTETRKQRRKDELKYPWDHTRDNILRPRTKKGKKSFFKEDNKEEGESYYPEHDPFGLYRPYDKNERKKKSFDTFDQPGSRPKYTPSYTTPSYSSPRAQLAGLRVRAAALPGPEGVDEGFSSFRSPSYRPFVSYVDPDSDGYYSDGDTYDSYHSAGYGSRKIAEGSGEDELDEFERKVKSAFRKSYGPQSAEGGRSIGGYTQNMGAKSELGSGSSPSYYGGGGGYGGSYPVREETVIRTSIPRTGSVHSVPRRNFPVSRGFRAGSLPPPSPRGARRGLPVRTRLEFDSEVDYEPLRLPDSRPPPSMSGLRSRATDAKNKLDAHRTMLDRYLPIYMGPEAEVADEVNYKYGELVQRIPRLEPYRPNRDEGGYSSSSPLITPYRRASLPPKPPSKYDNALRRPPMNLRVSEPRRRAREVLCKTKNDPHYYDY